MAGRWPPVLAFTALVAPASVDSTASASALLVPPACACFSFCRVSDALHAFAVLPVVHDERSPFYPYLRSVYNGSLALPFDMGTLGALLWPTTAAHGELAIPWDPTCRRSKDWSLQPSQPRCAAQTCVDLGWYESARLPRADALRAQPQRSQHPHANAGLLLATDVKSLPHADASAHADAAGAEPLPEGARGSAEPPPPNVIQLYGNLNTDARLGRRTVQPYILLRWGSPPDGPHARKHAPHPNHTWVEVLRKETHLIEGLVYGCWYWPLLEPYARGTGIFVNVGRTLVIPMRIPFYETCRKQLGLTALHGYPREYGPPPRYLVNGSKRRPRGGNFLASDELGERVDNHLALCARLLGYDSLQIMSGVSRRPELVMTTPECTIPGQRERRMRTCPPNELRTGWGATQPCPCAEDALLRRRSSAGGWESIPFESHQRKPEWPLVVLNCYGYGDGGPSGIATFEVTQEPGGKAASVIVGAPLHQLLNPPRLFRSTSPS